MSDDIKIENEDEQEIQNKIKKLKEQLKRCQKEKEEYLAGWQRAKADFINARKEEEKKQEEFAKFANQMLISDLLVILDSFDLAIQKIDEKGFSLIKAQLDDVLKKYGLTIIKTKGEKFNPEFHETVTEIESKKESGIIIEAVQRGYLLHNKVLRPAKVKISK